MPTITPSFSNLTISVIVPVYKGGEDFRRCMKALTDAMPPADEIIVAADGGMNHTPYPEKEFGIKIIETPVRSGPARARNIGARAAKGDILFFVDADVTIRPDALRWVTEVFHHDPDLTAVFGSYDDAPSASNFLSQYRNLLHHYVHQTGCEDASTFWGACGAIRHDVFLALDGFDEELYPQPAIEDIELGYRLKKAGYKIRLCKTLQIKHLKNWGIFSILKTNFFQRALPWTELILRDRQLLNDLNVDTSSRISVMLTFGVIAALPGVVWRPGFLIVAGLLSLLLLRLNVPLYRFFQRKRGLWFAVKTIPWHWLYFLYSGLAFVIGVVRHVLNTRRTSPENRKKVLPVIPKSPEKFSIGTNHIE